MAARDDRWAWLEDLRLQTATDILAKEAGKHLADEILAWPPRVHWTDPVEQAKFAPLFASGAAMPRADAMRLGFELARLELRREHDANAHALRDATVAGNPDDMLAARFVWRWMSEWLFELNERTASQIRRAQLIAAIDHAEARVAAALRRLEN